MRKIHRIERELIFLRVFYRAKQTLRNIEILDEPLDF